MTRLACLAECFRLALQTSLLTPVTVGRARIRGVDIMFSHNSPELTQSYPMRNFLLSISEDRERTTEHKLPYLQRMHSFRQLESVLVEILHTLVEEPCCPHFWDCSLIEG